MLVEIPPHHLHHVPDWDLDVNLGQKNSRDSFIALEIVLDQVKRLLSKKCCCFQPRRAFWAISWVRARILSDLELRDEIVDGSSIKTKMFRAERGCCMLLLVKLNWFDFKSSWLKWKIYIYILSHNWGIPSTRVGLNNQNWFPFISPKKWRKKKESPSNSSFRKSSNSIKLKCFW